ncbi:helix-hairpin-helix domain-containing protein [Anaerobacillus sp. HL2]|nr:helix-hairpin-helix domain-containing protein [Anaerobacillus sp. HL2]
MNINTASIEELQEIPGIGPAKARTIISYREENGKFNSSPDELVQVSGIGQKTVEKMLDYIVAK